jgi:hypothetical protein
MAMHVLFDAMEDVHDVERVCVYIGNRMNIYKSQNRKSSVSPARVTYRAGASHPAEYPFGPCSSFSLVKSPSIHLKSSPMISLMFTDVFHIHSRVDSRIQSVAS